MADNLPSGLRQAFATITIASFAVNSFFISKFGDARLNITHPMKTWNTWVATIAFVIGTVMQAIVIFIILDPRRDDPVYFEPARKLLIYGFLIEALSVWFARL